MGIVLLRDVTDEIFWLDVNLIGYTAEEVDDLYLKNILYFISEGKGWRFFLTEEKIYNLFKEAYRRNLLRADMLFTLHALTLYYHGYSNKKPRYKITYEGAYERI